MNICLGQLSATNNEVTRLPRLAPTNKYNSQQSIPSLSASSAGSKSWRLFSEANDERKQSSAFEGIADAINLDELFNVLCGVQNHAASNNVSEPLKAAKV